MIFEHPFETFEKLPSFIGKERSERGSSDNILYFSRIGQRPLFGDLFDLIMTRHIPYFHAYNILSWKIARSRAKSRAIPSLGGPVPCDLPRAHDSPHDL